MDNPVVVRAQEVCGELGLATLRFNFRGAGASGGVHGGGVSEQDDAAAALDTLAKTIGEGVPAIAGYSFGARIAALLAGRDGRISGLALIAPPLAMFDFGFLEDRHVPTLIVAGTPDQYCPPDDFKQFIARRPWATAASGATYRPPSENESGVTLMTPITSGRWSTGAVYDAIPAPVRDIHVSLGGPRWMSRQLSRAR